MVWQRQQRRQCENRQSRDTDKATDSGGGFNNEPVVDVATVGDLCENGHNRGDSCCGDGQSPRLFIYFSRPFDGSWPS